MSWLVCICPLHHSLQSSFQSVCRVHLVCLLIDQWQFVELISIGHNGILVRMDQLIWIVVVIILKIVYAIHILLSLGYPTGLKQILVLRTTEWYLSFAEQIRWMRSSENGRRIEGRFMKYPRRTSCEGNGYWRGLSKKVINVNDVNLKQSKLNKSKSS